MDARIPLLLAIALAGGCGFRPTRTPSDATKEPAYSFPHSTHVDADVACEECHVDVVSATKLVAGVRHVRIVPGASKRDPCSSCHDKDPTPTLPARTREFRVRFSHADHLKRVTNCRRCHATLTEPGETAPHTPPMKVCTSCHVHQMHFAQARCTPCHVDLRGYKPETAFRHEGNWLQAHGALARPSAETCIQCHDQTYCAACHSSATAASRLENVFPERVDRAFIHRGDYVSRHMIDAGANPASCRRCHGSGFCEACHALEKLSKLRAGPLGRPESHLQSGWVDISPGASQRHGAAARRDISVCAGCHDQGADATCVLCHRVGAFRSGGGTAASPHPRKFLETHDLGDIAANSMCRACHG